MKNENIYLAAWEIAGIASNWFLVTEMSCIYPRLILTAPLGQSSTQRKTK